MGREFSITADNKKAPAPGHATLKYFETSYTGMWNIKSENQQGKNVFFFLNNWNESVGCTGNSLP
jgi:hypothetical protein